MNEKRAYRTVNSWAGGLSLQVQLRVFWDLSTVGVVELELEGTRDDRLLTPPDVGGWTCDSKLSGNGESTEEGCGGEGEGEADHDGREKKKWRRKRM